MKKRMGRSFLLASLVSLLLVASITLYVHRVDNTVNQEDERFLAIILDDNGQPPRTFADLAAEIKYIRKVQTSVFAASKGQDAIPFGHPREPRDLVERNTGWCFDKSRVIEKALRRAGFQTRHISLYEQTSEIPGKELLIPGARSHALTEVETSGGWLVVDSLDPWISLNATGTPVSIAQMQSAATANAITWHPEFKPFMNDIYQSPFIYVFGLYSRHGKFYPPYTPIPDLHYGELLANF